MEIILTLVIAIPLLGVLGILLVRNSDELVKWVALFTASASFVLSLPLLFNMDPGTINYIIESEPLISGYDVKFLMGLDGLSMMLFMLTTFIGPIVILSAWRTITEHVAAFYSLILIFLTGSLGVFAAMDLFIFYIFFELTVFPVYFLIGIWGGANRLHATIKFFLYTLVGWLIMLIALIFVGYAAGDLAGEGIRFTTDWRILSDPNFQLGLVEQTYLFLAFALALFIKVPIFPFHTWLPHAHTEAPTAGSVLLAAITLKMGTYGIVRFMLPMFPNAVIEFAPYVAVLAVIGIIYGALVAMVQKDVKKLVAYSSVSHMGFVMLGIFTFNSIGMQGALLQMVNHGLATGALFLIVGMIYERRHSRMIADFGGVAKVMPVFAVMFMIATLASIGLPGLNGFVGEFLILMGTFNSDVLTNIWFTILATSGVILAAAYMLWMYRRVMFGQLDKEENKKLTDINAREIGLLLPLMLFMVWIGIRPGDFMQFSEQAVDKLLDQTHEKASVIQSNSDPEELPSWAGWVYDRDLTSVVAAEIKNQED